MTTRVVNIRKAQCDVYCGRAGKGQEGFHGNPVHVGERCFVCNSVHTDRNATLPCFRRYFFDRLTKDYVYLARTLLLRDKVLGCFCKPDVCHCDVIADWVDNSKPVFAIGFTGTRVGMTEAQYHATAAVVDGFIRTSEGQTVVGLHGDCVGADHHFDVICERAELPRWKYPGNLTQYVAHTAALALYGPRPPLERNETIVRDCRTLVACPRGQEEEIRSGTWTTVRRAYKMRRPITLVFPDGTVSRYKEKK